MSFEYFTILKNNTLFSREMEFNFPSKVLFKAIESFNSLPGVGRKTALRYTLNMLKMQQDEILRFADNIRNLAIDIRFCDKCRNISDQALCDICANTSRKKDVICVVQDVRDVLAIENTQQYNGMYHVLGGVISPIDGIGPSDLNIESLAQRVVKEEVKEIILALSTTMEGDTTNFYIYRKLGNLPVNITTIARGMGFGDEIEYTDELTLGRSILNRIPYKGGALK